MAESRSYLGRTNFSFLSNDRESPISGDSSVFEFDESDVWNTARSASPEYRGPAPSVRFSRKHLARRAEVGDRVGGTASSVPVNIPDWSKILKDEYRENRRRDNDDDEDVDDGGKRIPPHVFLARTRIASFSVHEGIGRTLKGRDLRRVRNAIWEKIGFKD